MIAEPKTTVNDADVDAFLGLVADPVKQADARTLLETMMRVTRRPAKMWGNSIVGFGSYHYTYASGRSGDWPLTGFSPRKQALTLYIMAGFDNYENLLARLGKYKTGKSCLYVKRLTDVDQKVLSRLVRESVAYMRKNYPTR